PVRIGRQPLPRQHERRLGVGDGIRRSDGIGRNSQGNPDLATQGQRNEDGYKVPGLPGAPNQGGVGVHTGTISSRSSAVNSPLSRHVKHSSLSSSLSSFKVNSR